MKLRLNGIWKKVIWGVLITATLVSLAFINNRQSSLLCKELNISIAPDTVEGFIDREEVIDVLTSGRGLETLLNKPFDSDSIPGMEARLKGNGFLESADVFMSLAGELSVRIKQRKPLVRVMRMDGSGYYIDDKGMKMPLSDKYAARVMIATGNLYEKFTGPDSVHSYVAKELYTLGLYVDKNPFWKAQIEQIFVNGSSELLLVPKAGNHTIILGSTEDLEEKLSRLLVFYKKAMPKAGWSTYKTINLKFKDQVVCEKY